MRQTSIWIALSVVLMAWSVQAGEERTGPGVDDVDGIVTFNEEEEAFFSCIEESTLDQLMGLELEPTNVCIHGQFKRVEGDHGFSHGFGDLPYPEDNWTGTMQSWLVWSGADRGFQCTFEDGELIEDSCIGLGGVFPTEGSTFWQECRVYDHLGLELELALTDFGCRVRGNVESV